MIMWYIFGPGFWLMVVIAIILFSFIRSRVLPPVHCDTIIQNVSHWTDNLHPLLRCSATELAYKIRTRQVTVTTLLEIVLSHTEKVNVSLNAVIGFRREEAFSEARQMDEYLSSYDEKIHGSLPPFFGVPLFSKECFATAGQTHTSGLVSRFGPRETHAAIYSSPVIQNLQRAGFIILGVTNTSELCMWMESSNSIFGGTNNPYDLSRTAGGSSGGAGSITAAGGPPVALGSDVGGSIRMPCFFNGLYGHKPTGGVASVEGQWPPSTGELERYCQPGPIARFPGDLWPVLQVMSGIFEGGLTGIDGARPSASHTTTKVASPLECVPPLSNETTQIGDDSNDIEQRSPRTNPFEQSILTFPIVLDSTTTSPFQIDKEAVFDRYPLARLLYASSLMLSAPPLTGNNETGTEITKVNESTTISTTTCPDRIPQSYFAKSLRRNSQQGDSNSHQDPSIASSFGLGFDTSDDGDIEDGDVGPDTNVDPERDANPHLETEDDVEMKEENEVNDQTASFDGNVHHPQTTLTQRKIKSKRLSLDSTVPPSLPSPHIQMKIDDDNDGETHLPTSTTSTTPTSSLSTSSPTTLPIPLTIDPTTPNRSSPSPLLPSITPSISTSPSTSLQEKQEKQEKPEKVEKSENSLVTNHAVRPKKGPAVIPNFQPAYATPSSIHRSCSLSTVTAEYVREDFDDMKRTSTTWFSRSSRLSKQPSPEDEQEDRQRKQTSQSNSTYIPSIYDMNALQSKSKLPSCEQNNSNRTTNTSLQRNPLELDLSNLVVYTMEGLTIDSVEEKNLVSLSFDEITDTITEKISDSVTEPLSLKFPNLRSSSRASSRSPSQPSSSSQNTPRNANISLAAQLREENRQYQQKQLQALHSSLEKKKRDAMDPPLCWATIPPTTYVSKELLEKQRAAASFLQSQGATVIRVHINEFEKAFDLWSSCIGSEGPSFRELLLQDSNVPFVQPIKDTVKENIVKRDFQRKLAQMSGKTKANSNGVLESSGSGVAPKQTTDESDSTSLATAPTASVSTPSKATVFDQVVGWAKFLLQEIVLTMYVFYHIILCAVAPMKTPYTLPALLLALVELVPKLTPAKTKQMIIEANQLSDKLHQILTGNLVPVPSAQTSSTLSNEAIQSTLSEWTSQNSSEGKQKQYVLLFPAHPVTARKHRKPYINPFDWIYTGIFNALKNPVTSVPCGLSPQSGLPTGIQVVGAKGDDWVTIGVAMALHQQFRGWETPHSIYQRTISEDYEHQLTCSTGIDPVSDYLMYTFFDN